MADMGKCSYPGCDRDACVTANGAPACAIPAHIDHVFDAVFAEARETLRAAGLLPRP